MTPDVPKVVVVGGTYVDMAIRCSHIPSLGKSVTGSSLSYSVTGPGPNQAVEAALCRCQVNLISKIGGDQFADMVTQTLTEFNVNTEFLYTAEAKNTGALVTLVNSTGENADLIYNGANSALMPRDIDTAENVIAGADICLIHGQLPQEAIVRAICCAKLHGTKVILNPARPLEQTDQHAELPIEYFNADILIPNLYEAAQITEHSPANINAAKLIASDLVARGPESAIITMGKRGCVVADRSGADHIPAFEVELLDHTATGDAFAGALAASCAVGDSIRTAATFASAAGALVCTKFGTAEAMPKKAEIIELLQQEDMG